MTNVASPLARGGIRTTLVCSHFTIYAPWSCPLPWSAEVLLSDSESFLLSFLGPPPLLNRVGLRLLRCQEGLEAAWGDVKMGHGGSWFFILVPQAVCSGTEMFIKSQSLTQEGAPPQSSVLSGGCKMQSHPTPRRVLCLKHVQHLLPKPWGSRSLNTACLVPPCCPICSTRMTALSFQKNVLASLARGLLLNHISVCLVGSIWALLCTGHDILMEIEIENRCPTCRVPTVRWIRGSKWQTQSEVPSERQGKEGHVLH